MPKRRKISKRAKKGNHLSTRKSTHLVSLGSYLPDRMDVKLTYYDHDSPYIQTGGLTYGSNSYKLNSAYDVNGSIASTAMNGYAEWSAFYNNYRVIGVRYHITGTNTTGAGMTVVWFPRPNYGVYAAGSSGAIFNTLENPYSKMCVLAPKGGRDVASMSGYIDIGKLFGSPKQYSTDPNFAGTIAADPVNIFYGYLYVTSTDGQRLLIQ